MVFQNQQELDAYAEWAKTQLKGMAEHVSNSDLFHDEVMGHAVWTLPHRLFIGKAWPKSDRNKAYWIISGVDIPTDHIESAVAETAREAARHFSMKWQLQSARLGNIGQQDSGATASDDIDWETVSARLQAQAEALYGLVENEDLWRQTEGPLVSEPA
jgi:hypothetical protein